MPKPAMEFPVHLNLRRKGAQHHERIGIVDLGRPLRDGDELTVTLPDGSGMRVRIDENHLIPVHDRSEAAVPIIYVSEV